MSAKDKFQRFLILCLFSISFFYGGYYFGKRGYEFEIKKNPPEIVVINKTPKDTKIDFSMFWEVWEMVSKEYLNRPVDGQKMLYGAIEGMVEALGDPYTAYLPPEINKAIMDGLNNTYQGIGAELGLRDDQLIVVAPLDGSPAKDAGVRAGDKILKIDGYPTIGMSITEAVVKIRGAAGTVVALTLQTGNQDIRDTPITRGVIKLESVTWEDKGEGTTYLRVNRFGDSTNKEWDKTVAEINTQVEELDALILDLRGNPGGYMMGAVYIANEFFSEKAVLVQQEATGEEHVYKTNKGEGSFYKVPKIIVLIDEGSASASEILAAALKEQVGAILVGEKSFGKGTIQDAIDFGDGSGIHITTAKWLTPSKVWVHDKGLEPDIYIERTDDDWEKDLDPQLDKAIELGNEV